MIYTECKPDSFLSEKLVDYEYPAELVKQALANLPKV